MNLSKTIEEEYENIQGADQKGIVLPIEEVKANILLGIWNQYCKDINKVFDEKICFYNSAYFLLYKKKITYSPNCITKLSMMLPTQGHSEKINNVEDRGSAVGMFLTALINYHFEKTKNKKYELHTSSAEFHLDYVGYLTAANVHIHGNLGDYVGYRMNGGVLRIFGNAQYDVGLEMGDSEIHLSGFCLNVAKPLHRGKIFINGAEFNYKAF